MIIQMLIEQPQAAFFIVQRTPTWVWGLLAALLVLGAQQMRARSVPPVRTLLLPLGLALFSLGGLARDLQSTRWLLPAIGLWLLTVAALLLASRHRSPPAGVCYQRATRRLHLPGSTVPFFFILAIFFLKYGVGVELALQPDLREQGGFALGLAAVSGALSGLLAMRSVGLWRFARQKAAEQTLLSSTGAAT